jgi:hypothetical protein
MEKRPPVRHEVALSGAEADGAGALKGPLLSAARVAWVTLSAVSLGIFAVGTFTAVTDPLPLAAETGDPFTFTTEDLEVARGMGLPEVLVTGPLEAVYSIVNLAYFAIAVWIFLLVLLFPYGRFAPRWTAFMMVPLVALALGPSLQYEPPDTLLLVVVLGLAGVGVYSRVHRYRRVSGPLERLQTKWVGMGLMGTLGVMVLSLVSFAAFPAEEPTPARVYFLLASVPLVAVLALLFPISVAVAVLRYRLWGVDALISRTLVYGSLTAILGGMYIASIQLFRALFTGFSGEKSDAAVVLTTLVVAASFTRIRMRLQSLVDARFKELPDPTRRLRAFRERAESFVQLTDPARVAHQLLTEATAAFDAASGTVSLQRNGRLQPVQEVGEPGRLGTLEVPLEHQGRPVGPLSLGGRRNGRPYTDHDRETLRRTAEVVSHAMAIAERRLGAPEEVMG